MGYAKRGREDSTLHRVHSLRSGSARSVARRATKALLLRAIFIRTELGKHLNRRRHDGRIYASIIFSAAPVRINSVNFRRTGVCDFEVQTLFLRGERDR